MDTDFKHASEGSLKIGSRKISGVEIKPRHGHHKSIASIHDSHFDQRIDSLTTFNENLRLEYRIEELSTENQQLKTRIKKIENKLTKEIKQRDEVIISLTNLMKERENDFKKIFSEQSGEMNRIIGKKDIQLQNVKKELKSYKIMNGESKKSTESSRQEIEIENLRKLLFFAEKENKELEKALKNADEQKEDIDQIIETDTFNDACYEISILLSKLNRIPQIIKETLRSNSSPELIQSNSYMQHYDVNKSNVIKSIEKGFTITAQIEKQILDVYAMQCANKCHVQ